MSLPHRTRTALAALVLVAAPLAVTGAGDAAGPDAASTVIASSSEAAPAFRRPADVLRARLMARAHAPAARPVKPGTATSTSFAFNAVLDGRPVRWNPCAPIRWSANVSRGPVGGLAVLQQAVARVAAVTGTSWQYVGPSAAVPTSAYLPRKAQASYPPVLLGWTDGARSDLLAGQPSNVLGMARTAWFGVQSSHGRRTAAVRAGVVAFDRTDRLALRGPHSWYAVALHELGHVMGLDHVKDQRQLMSATLPAAVDFQPGDHAGLVALGRKAGCVTVP